MPDPHQTCATVGNSSVLIISTRFQRRQDRLPSVESVIRLICGAARGRRQMRPRAGW